MGPAAVLAALACLLHLVCVVSGAAAAPSSHRKALVQVGCMAVGRSGVAADMQNFARVEVACTASYDCRCNPPTLMCVHPVLLCTCAQARPDASGEQPVGILGAFGPSDAAVLLASLALLGVVVVLCFTADAEASPPPSMGNGPLRACMRACMQTCGAPACSLINWSWPCAAPPKDSGSQSPCAPSAQQRIRAAGRSAAGDYSCACCYATAQAHTHMRAPWWCSQGRAPTAHAPLPCHAPYGGRRCAALCAHRCRGRG